jgi:hypothetical protein
MMTGNTTIQFISYIFICKHHYHYLIMIHNSLHVAHNKLSLFIIVHFFDLLLGSNGILSFAIYLIFKSF